ncbi:hypothetical protein [Frigidibacter mobilis]|uniref:Uncharacterized protein n=1 Tax=Frigidibacter mobilis TaxID=1335048 RepID=A0A159Z2E7_9RHOB|nr:hypothetical protein [Frigidibacter mobilis]AMY68308.1 hypothetical protein AKL17_1049 [Frigidibacter mobilis]
MSTKLPEHSRAAEPDGVVRHLSSSAMEATNRPKKNLQSGRRDVAAIQKKMRENAVAEGQTVRCSPQAAFVDFAGTVRDDIGLTLRDLEERRWSVSPSLARQALLEVGLPYEGRRAGLIYSWRSVFRAEGINDDEAGRATRDGRPELFDDLLDTSVAATFLGYRDSSSIRKLVASRAIPEGAYITFGSRGVYRFRQAGLRGLRRPALMGRIV